MNSGFFNIKEGKVLVDHGPITMVIEAKKDANPYTYAAEMGARKALELLKELSCELSIAQRMMQYITLEDRLGLNSALKTMIHSVQLLDEEDFTPMAAVAGTFSDLVKTKVLESGADYAVVNNGGDISYHTHKRYSMRIGVISDLANSKPTHVLKIRNNRIQGIATSGYGGRSLTKGIASAVTALSTTCSLADAAATSIGNATNCDHPNIERCLAEEVDYSTDIKGEIITNRIGDIDIESVDKALENGRKRAIKLYEQKMILGVVIFVRDRMVVYPDHPINFTINAIY